GQRECGFRRRLPFQRRCSPSRRYRRFPPEPGPDRCPALRHPDDAASLRQPPVRPTRPGRQRIADRPGCLLPLRQSGAYAPRRAHRPGTPDEIAMIEISASTRFPLGMPPARFLREYWQRRPLLVRGAFPGFRAPLSPEDLAGLACEELALARLVTHEPVSDHWAVRSGPFTEADFAHLPKSHSTMLLWDVDKWDAEVAGLLASFDFLPCWRIDDVMVSYAEDGGSVGAHV